MALKRNDLCMFDNYVVSHVVYVQSNNEDNYAIDTNINPSARITAQPLWFPPSVGTCQVFLTV